MKNCQVAALFAVFSLSLCLLGAAAPAAWAQDDASPTAETPSDPSAGDPSAGDPPLIDMGEAPAAEDAGMASEDAEASGEEGAEDSAETTEGEPASWSQQVDKWFGKYLVEPVSAVIFFDFGTKNWLGVSIPFVVVWLLCGGVFLTIRMRFINFRAFRHALRLTRGD